MTEDTIVQFVSFETTMVTNEFREQWEEYNKQVSGKQEVTLQQEVDGKILYRYLSQHRLYENDFTFSFQKERRSPRGQEIELRIKEAGGYLVVQQQCDHETTSDSCKVFVFLSSTPDLENYKQLLSYQYLNIYQAYYENCSYTFIMEFFVENSQVIGLVEQLKLHNQVAKIGIYKECNAAKKAKNLKTNIARKEML